MNLFPFRSPGTPNQGDDNTFKRQLINSIIAVLMLLSATADHYQWADLSYGIDCVKWLLDLIALFL
jgi:hypothetical protein